jgi:L-amino acid N-acyltransferase YncA
MAAEAGRIRIRAVRADDAGAIAAIYAPYVEGSMISFELEAPDPAAMLGRIEAGGALYPWLAAEGEDGILAGYAYATAFRPRPAYRYAVETTLYVRKGDHGRGIGTILYRPLLEMLEAQGFAHAFAAISLPNAGSVAIHQRCGFAHAGTYAKVGFKLDRWWDVGLWQRPLAPLRLPPTEPRPWREIWDQRR